MATKKDKFIIYVELNHLSFIGGFISKINAHNILKNCSIKTKTNKINYGNLTIEFPSKEYYYLKPYFLNLFTDYFVEFFKYEYLNNNILLPTLKEAERDVLIKALTYLDLDIDKELVFNALKDFKYEIFLESFFNFKLKHIKKRWDELIKLANENNFYFANNLMFIELLKFIISNLQTNINYLNISYNNGFVLENNGFETKFNSNENELNVVAKIIGNLPKKIMLKDIANFPQHSLSVICDIFENKIEF